MENHAWPNSLNLQNIITFLLKSDAIFYSLRDINDNKLNWAIVKLRNINTYCVALSFDFKYKMKMISFFKFNP